MYISGVTRQIVPKLSGRDRIWRIMSAETKNENSPADTKTFMI